MSRSVPLVGSAVSDQARVAGLADALVQASGCWAATLSFDGRRLAYVSDRRGTPEAWVETVSPDAGPGANGPLRLVLSEDPVLNVRWSPDGQWLAAAVASGGGVRTEVWVIRPDGTHARRLAGRPDHAILGPWARRGSELVVTIRSADAGRPARCVLIDPLTGDQRQLASGGLVEVLDLSEDGRFALLRDGSRGAQFCVLLDCETGRTKEILPHRAAGSTDRGLLRPPPSGDVASLVAYLVTDAGQTRTALVAVPLDEEGSREGAGAVAQREDADLEWVDGPDDGRSMLLAWNVAGRTELEHLDTVSGQRRRIADIPGDVIHDGVVARNAPKAVLSVDSPGCPCRLWELELTSGSWRPITPRPESLDGLRLVSPTLETFESHDGLPLSGWLYRPPEPAPGKPGFVYVHGGPEAQERPVFNPLLQVLVAAGITVFAPNIRGSSGFGRTFVHADDRLGRLDAIADLRVCGQWLAATGAAAAGRIAVGGRSYGGYATLMVLVVYPGLYAAGVDICGMSDLLTFFRDTEPWIARAAVTKYGDPDEDADLLAALSPLRSIERVQVPLLVVHGELDTNVPVGEAHQVVRALRLLGRDVRYLELQGEGHEYRRVESRRLLLGAVWDFLTQEEAQSSGDQELGGEARLRR